MVKAARKHSSSINQFLVPPRAGDASDAPETHAPDAPGVADVTEEFKAAPNVPTAKETNAEAEDDSANDLQSITNNDALNNGDADSQGDEPTGPEVSY
jgi:hypothetical protein